MSQRDQDPSSKTEDPTQRKIDDALEKGNVAKSQEVSNVFMLATMGLFLIAFIPSMATGIRDLLIGFLARPHSFIFERDVLIVIMREISIEVVGIMAAPVLLIAASGIAGNLIQHPPIFSTAKLKPDMSKHNPFTNLKKKFSLRQLVQFGMSLAKMALVVSVVGMLFVPKASMLTQLMTVEPEEIPPLILELALWLVGAVTIVMIFITGLDLAYQKWEHMKSQRMSRTEVKDEHKESDGSPEVKKRLREIRNEKGRARMMSQIPDATVVVTNPTHYAIALKYEHGEMDAPIVVAKGADHLALRIREAAKEHRIPIVENKPLAQALYATAELDREIPLEHFQAVAEVIGYIMKLKGRKLGARTARAQPTIH